MHNTQHGRLIDRRGFLGLRDIGRSCGAGAASRSGPGGRIGAAGAAGTGRHRTRLVCIRDHCQIGRAPRRQRRELRLRGQGGAVDLPQRPRSLRLREGLAPEVEGPPGYPLSGRPPLRREADYILGACATILKEFGTDLPQAVRVDQYYTQGSGGFGLSPRALRRVRRLYPAEHLDHHGSLLHRAHQHARVAAGGRARSGVGDPKDHPARPADFASGYNPAVVANDFVFVAGNMALLDTGELPPAVRIRPTAQWGGQTGFRRQVDYAIKERLEPSLKAAGSGLEQLSQGAGLHPRHGNFPDFMDVWSQHFSDIPCALTVVPAKRLCEQRGHDRDQPDRVEERSDTAEAGRRGRYSGAGDIGPLRPRR